MTGPAPSVAAVRLAVRRCLTEAALPPNAVVLVAVSGGADSLALASAVAFEAPGLGLRAGSITVDHQLQSGSAAVAHHAAAQCADLGLQPALVERVDVADTRDGPEAAARAARYAALAAAANRSGAEAVLLGHTRDDQAETVLLGLARGSGARAVTGMSADSRATPEGLRLLRPLLGITRAQTHEACAALDLQPWHDPHNDDPRYLRVRVRRALAELESEIGPGVTAGLARTAALVRQDCDELDRQAAAAAYVLGEPPWQVAEFTALAPALRSRVWRAVLTTAGSPGGDLGKVHVDAVDALLTAWRGQGPIDIPGGLRVRRQHGVIEVLPRQVQ
ncbi:tRNA lysidine(34) synthetase TilS [Rudaeicoccus suwonensis]|uniref:tRNA(Ile)-lysidine synthase n=1 Tax=Rudaeicoccus suwonensis TaxID=657409 RepID=A0A561E2W6_9MICO|nr:tRNA lysidine(34) synthetase TilS [Rudaeicoccus suwonensis]TWE09954.1 tRNA(Ile)-lysidine synthase [Rudaeicoccus suwonensis]